MAVLDRSSMPKFEVQTRKARYAKARPQDQTASGEWRITQLQPEQEPTGINDVLAVLRKASAFDKCVEQMSIRHWVQGPSSPRIVEAVGAVEGVSLNSQRFMVESDSGRLPTRSLEEGRRLSEGA